MRVGAESPLLTSCSGRIFYALADDLTRKTLIQCSKELGEDVSAARTIDEVSESLRTKSYYEMASAQVEGIVDIGSPVMEYDGTMAASLVIPFLHRIDKDNEDELGMVREHLVKTAVEISSSLGAN